MLNYDKIYERVVQRGDKILEQRREKAVKIKQTSCAVSGLCAAAIVGVSVWRIASSNKMNKSDFNENNIVDNIENIPTNTTKSNDIVTTKTATSSYSTTVSTTKETSADSITKNTSVVTTANISQTMPKTGTVSTTKENVNTHQTTITTNITQSYTTTTSITTKINSTTTTPDNPNINPSTNESPIKDKFLSIQIEDGMDFEIGETHYKSYLHTSADINKELLEHLLYVKHIQTEYYEDNRLKTIETNIEIYSVKGVSSKTIVAIKFEDEDKYYIYNDLSYHPDTLRSFIDDLSMSSDGLSDYAYINGNKYEDINNEKVWSMLTENIDLPNDYDYFRDHVNLIVPKVSFSYTSTYISAISGSIGVSTSGYISTNVGRNGSYFYIGEDKAKQIIEYITQNW